MSIHVCKCKHNGIEEYHLRYPGLSEDEAQNIADMINGGALSLYQNTKKEVSWKAERLEQWTQIASWIHDQILTFDGNDSARSSLLSEISRVLDMAFGHMPTAIEYVTMEKLNHVEP